jgi:hypothetical protein
MGCSRRTAAPDDVPVGVAEEPVIPEMVQVMRWIGFDEVKAGRWQLRFLDGFR